MKPNFIKVSYDEYKPSNDFRDGYTDHVEKYINVNHISEIIPNRRTVIINGKSVELNSSVFANIMESLIYNK